MSVQFGRCNFDGKPVDPQELDRVRPVLAMYGPDAEGIFRKNNVGIMYRAFHTTKQSRLENQPYVSHSGAIITWDGRLDNRQELIERLAGEVSFDSPDLEIAVAAYEQWATNSFARLIGDWALSIWSPKDNSLILAKDFIGTRHLYYSFKKDRVTWCTILDPLVQFAGHSFEPEEEYLAGWLSFFPATHLTPYVGIHAVPPSSFVRLAREMQRINKYWDFDPAKRIRYRTDAEYEEHFRVVFSESVRRRLRSDSPVLAELSGGVDSSSIVCMADEIARRDPPGTPRLETISYYDDSEPHWDERPYFIKVEAERNRAGFHIDVGKQEFVTTESQGRRFVATPGSIYRSTEASEQFAACIKALGSRVILCGIGGDEVTGGVPTPIPELQDLLATAQFRRLACQLKVWALEKRKPWFRLFFETARALLPPPLSGIPKRKCPVPWLNPNFINRTRLALHGYESRVKLFGPLPSFQENMATLEALRRQLSCDPLPFEPLYENRYPYLDRGLVEFLCAVPRDQLVRPGQRRSLMRRALLGIVPNDVLNRKRKAYVTRTPMAALSTRYASLIEMSRHMVTSSLGITDPAALREALQRAHDGHDVPVVHLIRTIEVESWLQRTATLKLLSVRASCEHKGPGSSLEDHRFREIRPDRVEC